jgi:hypothetical protein
VPVAWTSPRGIAFVSVAACFQKEFGPTSRNSIGFRIKILRVFAWFAGPDDQPRVVTDQFVEEDLNCAMTLIGSDRSRPPHLTWRDVDFERIDVHDRT